MLELLLKSRSRRDSGQGKVLRCSEDNRLRSTKIIIVLEYGHKYTQDLWIIAFSMRAVDLISRQIIYFVRYLSMIWKNTSMISCLWHEVIQQENAWPCMYATSLHTMVNVEEIL